MLEDVSYAGASVLILNIILRLILRKSLKSMWDVVNVLQFIVFFELIKVNLAPHARLFLTQLRRIILGEFRLDNRFT